MDDRFNTIAGWVLFAGVVALGSSLVAGEVFHSERPEKMGYPIEGVEVEGEAAEADKPIACYLASADAARGEQVFKKCAACHNVDPGGANALGPALYGVMGNPVGAHPGFAFTDALKSKGGTWDWETMSAWLANPKQFAPGTKMTFAGLSNPQDRADIMLFLNSRDNAAMQVPPATPEQCDPAAAAAPAGDNAAAPAEGGADANAAAPDAAAGNEAAPADAAATQAQGAGNAQ